MARKKAKYRCQTCGSNERLEVNHIQPALGRHGEISCIHHQDNLIVLCHECHVKVTAEQRAAGLFKRVASQPLTES